MVEAEALAGEDFAAEFVVLAIEPEEGFDVAGEGVGNVLADKAATVLGSGPGSNWIFVSAGCGMAEAFQNRAFARSEGIKLFFHFFAEFVVMCLKDQGIAESVAIVEHFFHMFSAKACFVCLITDITFHVRRAVSENEVEGVLLQFTFYKAEWTFVIGVYGIIKRDGI